MSKKAKVVVFLIVVVLLLVVLRPSFHATGQDQNTTTSLSFVTVTSEPGNGLRTYSRFAIVTPPVAGTLKGFQAQIAEKLQKRLSESALAYKSDWSSKVTTKSAGPPTVKAYKSTKEALKDGVEFILIVKPKLFKCSFLPIFKTWRSEVNIEGRAACTYQGDPKVPCLSAPKGVLGYGANADIELKGKITGIFSTSYLVSEVADSVAKQMANSLTEKVEESFSSKCEDMREKAKNL